MATNEISNQNKITKQRVSVFDRLGPRPSQNPSGTQYTESKDRKKENNYPERRQRGGGAHGKQQNPPRERPKNIDTAPVQQVHLKPNALLHRTLQDVKKERTKEAHVANPAAAIEDLEQRLQRAEEDRIAAEELSNALLLTQQALLQDKAKLQAENMQLQRELAALKERLEYLDLGGGATYPASGADSRGAFLAAGYGDDEYKEGDGSGLLDSNAGEEEEEHQEITPDSGMLRAIKMNAAAGIGVGGYDEFDDDALLVRAGDAEDLKEIKKKLEEEIC